MANLFIVPSQIFFFNLSLKKLKIQTFLSIKAYLQSMWQMYTIINLCTKPMAYFSMPIYTVKIYKHYETKSTLTLTKPYKHLWSEVIKVGLHLL